MYEQPDSDLSFGDIFSADWFFSAHLRRDAVPLVQVSVSKAAGGKAWQRAKPADNRDALFAHGLQRHAILVTDDCEAETMVKRRTTGRLVFAAIDPLPIGRTERANALSTAAFRQFPLPPDADYAGGVVKFQQLFAMHVDGVIPRDGDDPRVVRLDAQARQAFEMRWVAYITRRGPLTHIDNGEKLARLLTGGGDVALLAELRDGEADPTPEDIDLGRHVARTLSLAWELEGSAMNEISEVLENCQPFEPRREGLADQLAELAASAQRASDSLRQHH